MPESHVLPAKQKRIQCDRALQQELVPIGQLSICHHSRARWSVLPVHQDHRARPHTQKFVGENQGVTITILVRIKL